jgi:hypothetical protein
VLKLKVGACIMLPSNLDRSKGLLNGTNTGGQGLLAHFINAKTASGSTEGKHFHFLN